MKRLAVCALLALLGFPAVALEPYLVKDINAVAEPAGSDPSNLVTFRGAVLFFANDGISGNELWRSDGTAAGTFQLSEASGELGEPQPYVVTDQLYFFVSGNPIGGFASLWISDGTPAGTFRLTDPDVGVVGRPRVWVASQGILYFTGRDQEHGIELWSTDGTPAGTHLVADVRPGPEHSNLTGLTEYKGQAWFGADDGQHGGSLWRSDGTLAGTRLEVELVPGPGSFQPQFMDSLGGQLVISFYGEGLWVTDGTGTRKIHDREVTTSTYQPHAVFQGRLYYSSSSSGTIWVTDGTEAGTGPFLDHEGREIFAMLRFAILGGRLVFTAADLLGVFTLWESDGTPAGTFQVQPAVRINDPRELARAGDRVFFPSYDTSTGWELWAVRP